jgi:hypothetical protein
MAKIHSITYIDGAILCIYHDRIWQFQFLCSDGDLYQHEECFYSADAAERAARKWTSVVFG